MNKRLLWCAIPIFGLCACAPADKEVSACNYPNGCESKGWGDVEGYGTKEVGLCSYLGGCMESGGE